MAERFIDGDFEREVTLGEGSRIVLRLLRPSDRELLVAGMARLSSESRYRRFLSATTTLTPEALTYLTHTDNENHLAVVAIHHGEGVGVARFVRTAEGASSAEAAVTVEDRFHGRGIGRLLLAALTLAASERGVTHFQADILESNGPMLALLQQIGATRSPSGEAGVVRVELPLPRLLPGGDLGALDDGPGSQLVRYAARELHLLDAAPPRD
jgi:GNAT superfamily N-acetyltransferase